jgi:UPF0271 protein
MAQKLLVIDTCALLMGYNPLVVNAKQYTTYSVIDEIRQNTVQYNRLKLAIDTGKLRLYDPSTGVFKEVEEVSQRTGDLAMLSRTDLEILAVALELTRKSLSPILVSDDYGIQNVATFLGIDYCSLATLGIRYRFQWFWYCPACKKRFMQNISQDMVCDVCGTRLKRRVLKKEPLQT